MTINEVLEGSNTLVGILRDIGNKHPADATTQRLVAQGLQEVAYSLIKLNELLHYREKDSEAVDE